MHLSMLRLGWLSKRDVLAHVEIPNVFLDARQRAKRILYQPREESKVKVRSLTPSFYCHSLLYSVVS